MTPLSNSGADFTHKNVIPRVSHEGVQSDKASNGTVGSEFTGLYFDPTDKRRAWVNIQHPASGNDRTIEITIPK